MVDKILEQRGKRYGEFNKHAVIAQELKDVMRTHNIASLPRADMREALEMIQHKVARILNGDPTYDDNWLDIAGYATLVAERLQAKGQGTFDLTGDYDAGK